MAANSEIILSANTHPGDSTNETVTGEKSKGDGYYGRSDGFHTVQVELAGFLGKLEIQGTLAVDPTDNDWFAVSLGAGTTIIDTTGSVSSGGNLKTLSYTVSETSNKLHNFTGNYVWIRAHIYDWTDGSINQIKLNH